MYSGMKAKIPNNGYLLGENLIIVKGCSIIYRTNIYNFFLKKNYFFPPYNCVLEKIISQKKASLLNEAFFKNNLCV